MIQKDNFPRIIGHRGSAGTTPENTLLSFREAFEGGARAIEFDVVLTRDGVPVVFHDATLDRTTTGSGPIHEHTLAELKALDAGSWKLPTFTGEPIPTLEETLKLVREFDIIIDVELKPAPGRADATAKAAIEIIEEFWPGDCPTPLLSSFDPACLAVALDLKPYWPRLHLFDQYYEDWRMQIEKSQASFIGTTVSQPKQAIANFIDSGIPAYFYTVNAVKQAEILFRLGAAGLFTDYPAQMITHFSPLKASKTRLLRLGKRS
jgi:glycerophosphoryl diester phosphodiesterase